MKNAAILSLIVAFSAFTAASRSADDQKEGKKSKAPGFEQFKQLAGDWAGTEIHDGKEGDKVQATYKVTSAGTVVVETLFPGTEHEMVTVIHPDGEDLVLTHYCALGNQPRMKASGKADGNKFAFDFVGASNLPDEKGMHMHSVTFTFLDKDTLRTEWVHYNGGKPAGTATFQMKRVK
jgi:hypothetical protein